MVLMILEVGQFQILLLWVLLNWYFLNGQFTLKKLVLLQFPEDRMWARCVREKSPQQ